MEMTTRKGVTYLLTNDIFALIVAIRAYETPIRNSLFRGIDYNVIGPLFAKTIADCMRRRGERDNSADGLCIFYQQNRAEIISELHRVHRLHVDELNIRQIFFFDDVLADLENGAWIFTSHLVCFALGTYFVEAGNLYVQDAYVQDPYVQAEGGDDDDDEEESEEDEEESEEDALSDTSSDSDSDNQSYVTFSDLSTIDNWMSDDDMTSDDDGYYSL